MVRLNNERQKNGLPSVKPCEIFNLIGGTSTGGYEDPVLLVGHARD